MMCWRLQAYECCSNAPLVEHDRINSNASCNEPQLLFGLHSIREKKKRTKDAPMRRAWFEDESSFVAIKIAVMTSGRME